MHFFNYFYYKNLKFDLINKFHYSNLKKLPKLKKIVLNSSCKSTELKTLSRGLLSLEIITNQRGMLTISKRPNLSLKIRKGSPTGCKLTLSKSTMLDFICKISNEVFPKAKNFDGILIHKKVEKRACSFILKDILNFTELSENYYLFNNLSSFSLSFITEVNCKEEMLFILKSLQLPLKSSF